MTNKERKLLSELLEFASAEFSNHGCNDIPEELLEMFTDLEKESLIKEYSIYNSGKDRVLEDYDSYTQAFNCMPDWAWMSFFARKILKEE